MAGSRKSFVDESVLELAYSRIRHAYEHFDHVAVFFSGGKDSTACLNLTCDVARELGKPPVDVIFFDEEAIPLQTVEYVERVAQRPDVNIRWLCLPLKHRNACSRKSPYWYPWGPEDEEKWVRPFPERGIAEVPGFPIYPPESRLSHSDTNGNVLFPAKEYGNVAAIMGIRTQESMTRFRALTAKTVENWIVRYTGYGDEGNVFKVYPVYDWMTEDVWTAPQKFGWDYNRAYDVMEKAGVSRPMQRCSPAYGEEPLQKLWTYSICFPEIWDKMIDRVPGAATAARYALTNLYGYGGLVDKPPEMEWTEFIIHFLDKFPAKEKATVAERIQSEIRMHYSKTKDPILAESPHPLTGICWNFLLMLAMRGDFKNRKQAGYKVHQDEVTGLDKYWAKYNAELEATYGR